MNSFMFFAGTRSLTVSTRLVAATCVIISKSLRTS
jgi:hypothetical protein